MRACHADRSPSGCESMEEDGPRLEEGRSGAGAGAKAIVGVLGRDDGAAWTSDEAEWVGETTR